MGAVIERRLTSCGLLIAAWLSATGAFGTCNFFKPADPESPNRPPIIPDYSTPTATLQTLAKGMVDKNGSNGQDIYLSALAESTSDSRSDGRAYHAFFDLRDLIERPSWDRNRDWDRDLERVMYADLVRKYTSPYEMTWEAYEWAGNESGTPDVDSLLHRKYKIVQVIGTGESITRSPVAIGAADLYFVKSPNAANRWVIARWQDFHTVDADSAQVTLGKRRLETQ